MLLLIMFCCWLDGPCPGVAACCFSTFFDAWMVFCLCVPPWLLWWRQSTCDVPYAALFNVTSWPVFLWACLVASCECFTAFNLKDATSLLDVRFDLDLVAEQLSTWLQTWQKLLDHLTISDGWFTQIQLRCLELFIDADSLFANGLVEQFWNPKMTLIHMKILIISLILRPDFFLCWLFCCLVTYICYTLDWNRGLIQCRHCPGRPHCPTCPTLSYFVLLFSMNLKCPTFSPKIAWNVLLCPTFEVLCPTFEGRWARCDNGNTQHVFRKNFAATRQVL